MRIYFEYNSSSKMKNWTEIKSFGFNLFGFREGEGKVFFFFEEEKEENKFSEAEFILGLNSIASDWIYQPSSKNSSNSSRRQNNLNREAI